MSARLVLSLVHIVLSLDAIIIAYYFAACTPLTAEGRFFFVNFL